ncbi:ribonuclease H-like domain-containing protein, partial [Mycena vulgaris]
LSVTNLVKFPLPPMASSAAKYIVPDGHDWFSPDANHADLDLLRTVLVPPPSLIAQLIAECRQKWLDGAESISLPGSVHLFPLWTLDLWSEYQVTVKPQVDEWAAGIEWLSERALGVYQKEAKDTLRALSGLAWTGSIPYLTKVSPTQKFGNPVDSFARFLSRRWFSSRQIDQMTDYILDDIQSEVAPARDIRLMDMIITTEILKRIPDAETGPDTNDYDPMADQFLQRFGQSLGDGTELIGIFHVHDDHWVSATVDVLEQSIAYGDPMGNGAEATDVCLALQWFALQHQICLNSDIEPLLCTRQRDMWNCGLYAPNALAHKYLPDEYPLIGSHHLDGDVGRMSMLQNIILKFHERSNLDEYSKTPRAERHSRSPSPDPITPPPIDEISHAMGHLSVSPKKRPAKRRKTDINSSDDEPAIPTAPIFKKAAGKKAVSKQTEAAMLAMPSDVSDQEDSTSSAAGRPRSSLMDQLTVEVKLQSVGPIRKYRCAGPGCTKIFQPRSKMRVLNHTKRCIKLTSEQRQLASKCSADTSPGARAEELCKGLSAAELELPVPEPVEFFGSAATKQLRDRYAALLDLAIVKLFAAAALPPRLADYPEYKEVFRLAPLAGRHYVPAGRTILMDNHIMSEQERVRALQLEFLQTQTRLSISCDGGDLRSGEYFYTIHASTPNGRSFILEGFECTNVSHTAEWIADTVMEAMRPIGIERFSSASSDNTGNTRGFRRILCERIVTMLNLADPNHHLNNMLKDILKIPYFKLGIKILRGTVRHYNQSKQSKAMLKQLRISAAVGRGLETIGRTRFAIVTWSAISLRHNLPLVSELSTSGQKDTPKFLDFQMKLNQLIAVTEGAAKAIQCLEAASCNPADVYLLWLAVTAHLRTALAGSMLPEDVCNEIRGIVNHRWNEFFVTNPGHEAYLAAFYLNPKYVNSTIFKRPNAVAPLTITIPGTQKAPDAPIGVRNAKTFHAVGEYLFRQGALEVENGIDPVLIPYKRKKHTFSNKFKTQFVAYAQGAFPFNTPIGNMQPITWWRALEGSEHGGIVAALALKLYSAVAHSMADERTVSVITWMNPALRNLVTVNTIFSFAQIRAWYRDTRARARPHPEVKFYNIERDIHTVDDEIENDEEDLDADNADSDDEFNAVVDWLDLPRTIFPSSDHLDLESGEVDLDSPFLADVLAEVPGRGTESDGKGDEAQGPGDEEDEDDEMSSFELGSW